MGSGMCGRGLVAYSCGAVADFHRASRASCQRNAFLLCVAETAEKRTASFRFKLRRSDGAAMGRRDGGASSMEREKDE
jgi:hypothetical protein